MYPLDISSDMPSEISSEAAKQTREIRLQQVQTQSGGRLAGKRLRRLGMVAGSLLLAMALETIGADFLGGGLKAAQAQATRLPAIDPQQVPTARYGRGEDVDLSLIVEEWRDRFPAIPVYTCSCTAETCGDESIWPFKTFTLYQPFLALGAVNASNNEDTGFICFDIETGERP